MTVTVIFPYCDSFGVHFCKDEFSTIKITVQIQQGTEGWKKQGKDNYYLIF